MAKRSFWELMEESDDEPPLTHSLRQPFQESDRQSASRSDVQEPLEVVTLSEPSREEGAHLGSTRWAAVLRKVFGFGTSFRQERPVTVRTACSGTNAPLLALKERTCSSKQR